MSRLVMVLRMRNVGRSRRDSRDYEFNIGHNIIARSVFVGLETQCVMSTMPRQAIAKQAG